jgi:hypothetical protein
MKATYDARTDTLSIILKTDAVVTDSDEDKPGVILDGMTRRRNTCRPATSALAGDLKTLLC